MAYLNVRERRLETKIAYLGPALSGRATNFDQLGGGELGGDVLALYWKPKTSTTFRDCDVRVQLVTSRGEASDEQVIALVRDADGVVFVADADPAAQERNRASLERVREALALRHGREVPVVVQRNKADLPDAVSAESLTERLGLGAWPCVNASAATGQGVLETVERALETVLDALGKEPNDDLTATGETVRPAAARALPREGNPLLTALRQVLRETVMEEVDELERRIGERLERISTQAIADARGRSDEQTPLLRRMADDTSKLRSALDAAREETQMLEVTTSAATTALSSAVQKLAADVAAQRTELVALRRLVEGVAGDVKASDARPTLATMKVVLDATVKPIAAIAPRLEQLEETVQREVRGGARTVGAGIAAAREEAAVGAAAGEARTAELRALLEAVVEELKKPKKSWFT